MNVKIEIHKNHLIEKKLKALDKWKVPESTKKEIREFIDKAQIGQVNSGRKLSEATSSKYLTLLKKSLEIINKPTSKITKKDIEKYETKLSKQKLKSEADYKIDLQIFLKWKLGKIKANKIAGWLDVRRKSKTPDYLTEQEIEKLFKNCKNPSERYLIAVLFDSGARAEEFLNIRYEDIQMPDKNQSYVYLTLKEEYSKTKGRVISLYWKNSLGAVRDYLKERVEGKITEKKNKKGKIEKKIVEPIKPNEQILNKSYDAMRMFLYRLGKKVLSKEIYPHLFRHSSATHYAPKLNRQELCYRYGWAFSSNMPDVYISRSGMENKELDEQFKSTELEDLQKQFNKEKFERDLQIEELKKAAKWQEDMISKQRIAYMVNVQKIMPIIRKKIIEELESGEIQFKKGKLKDNYLFT